MCDFSVFRLLDAIRAEYSVAIKLARERSGEEGPSWLVSARDDDGQLWRSRNANLMFAAALLARMLAAAQQAPRDARAQRAA